MSMEGRLEPHGGVQRTNLSCPPQNEKIEKQYRSQHTTDQWTSYGTGPCSLLDHQHQSSTEESTTAATITLKTNNQQESHSKDHQLLAVFLGGHQLSLPQQSSQHTEGPVYLTRCPLIDTSGPLSCVEIDTKTPEPYEVIFCFYDFNVFVCERTTVNNPPSPKVKIHKHI